MDTGTRPSASNGNTLIYKLSIGFCRARAWKNPYSYRERKRGKREFL